MSQTSQMSQATVQEVPSVVRMVDKLLDTVSALCFQGLPFEPCLLVGASLWADLQKWEDNPPDASATSRRVLSDLRARKIQLGTELGRYDARLNLSAQPRGGLPAAVPARYLTRAEVAALLGVTASTLAGYVLKGRLLPTPETRGRGKKGLFDRADVLRLKTEVEQWKASRQASQLVFSPGHQGHQAGQQGGGEVGSEVGSEAGGGTTPPSAGSEPQVFKRCTKCQQLLPTIHFSVCKNVKSGLKSWCRRCINAQSALWHQRTKDRPERQARRKASKRAWEKANPERHAAQKKRSYQRCKARVRAYLRAWYERNIAYARAYSSAKYAANKQGKPRHLRRFLVELVDCRSCPKCRRLRSLIQFDRDNRTVDGYSHLCLECLPPRKSPPGNYLYELDRPRFEEPNGQTQHNFVADKKAVNPEEAALQIALWGFVDTLPANHQIILLSFMESLDLETAASECGIALEEATGALTSIRGAAALEFEGEVIR